MDDLYYRWDEQCVQASKQTSQYEGYIQDQFFWIVSKCIMPKEQFLSGC